MPPNKTMSAQNAVPISARKKVSSIFTHAALLLGVLLFAMPLYGLIVTALKSDAQVQDVATLSRMLIPSPVKWSNFAEVIRRIPFVQYFANSLTLVLLNVAGVCLVCPLVAYGFARFRWPGRDVVFFILLSTMMIPPQVTMVPVYLIFSELGWVNTFKPLWVPAWFGVPFFIFLLRQFFLGVPKELDEAAMIDGAGSLRTYWSIVLPQIRPAIIAIMLFQGVGSWNDFMGPLIYIHSIPKMPLALGIQSFMMNHGSEWPLLFAAVTMMTLPIIILFFLTQRFFVEGITLTGLKQ
ncbi:MAG TPA: carbohydrate ABC transporter permease [Candidatus Hydrogenedentes bacterium]|nr:carbohydrate ABC transporter permease [Candidatus Hydrogenedentota bacterium]